MQLQPARKVPVQHAPHRIQRPEPGIAVELGQLAVIALAWTVLVLLGERRRRRIAVLELGSAVAAMLGSYWFVVRGFS